MHGLRGGLVTAGVVAAAFLGGAFAQWLMGGCAMMQAEGAARPETLRAERFVVVDADGNEVGVFGATRRGPALVLHDVAGRPRISLGNGEADGGYWGLFCRDAGGNDRFVSGARADGKGAGLGIWDWNGQLRIGTGANEGGCGTALWNEDGREVAGMGAGAHGGADFVLKHPSDGREVWRASWTRHVAERPE